MIFFMITNISAQQLKELIKNQPEGLEIIDVRQPEEYAEGHIDGAKLIPLGQLPAKAGEINWTKDVIIYCRSGARSMHAAEFLSAQGKSVKNLEGGIVDFLG
jgi:rhodanese-related sulfurtransferase